MLTEDLDSAGTVGHQQLFLRAPLQGEMIIKARCIFTVHIFVSNDAISMNMVLLIIRTYNHIIYRVTVS